MKKPEKVKVTVGCLAFGTLRYLRGSVLSGAQITPDVLRELQSGSGTLEVVEATPVVKPDELKHNEEAKASDNTHIEVDSEKEIDKTGTEVDSKTEDEKSVKEDEKEVKEKVAPPTDKKSGKETRGRRKK